MLKNSILVKNKAIDFLPTFMKFNQSNKYEVQVPTTDGGSITRNPVVATNTLNSSSFTFFLPEIDSLTIRFHKRGREGLFQYLLRAGVETPLLSRFSEREKLNQPLTLVDGGEEVMKIFRIQSQKEKELSYCHYHLSDGGFQMFQLILKEDPRFLEELLEACNSHGSVDLYEIHFCLDFKVDLLPYVANCLKQGYYTTNGCRPYVYGMENGFSVSEYFKKRGDSFQQRKSNQLQIETVYFGTRQRNEVTVAFYDKKFEQLARKQDLTSIENIGIITQFIKNDDCFILLLPFV